MANLLWLFLNVIIGSTAESGNVGRCVTKVDPPAHVGGPNPHRRAPRSTKNITLHYITLQNGPFPRQGGAPVKGPT